MPPQAENANTTKSIGSMESSSGRALAWHPRPNQYRSKYGVDDTDDEDDHDDDVVDQVGSDGDGRAHDDTDP